MLLVLSLLLSAGPGELESVEREAVQLPPDQAVERVKRWADEHPDDPQLPRAWLWEAQQLSALKRYDEAYALLTRASQAKDDTAWDARLALADLLLARGQNREALSAYEGLGAPAGSRWEYQAKLRAAEARARGRLGYLLFMAILGLLGAALAVAVETRRALLPAPQEFVWSAPVLALFAIAGLTRPPGERFTVVAIAVAGMALTWLDGAWLRKWRPRGLRKLGAAAIVLAQLFLLVFIALVLGGLWDRVVDTFTGGVE